MPLDGVSDGTRKAGPVGVIIPTDDLRCDSRPAGPVEATCTGAISDHDDDVTAELSPIRTIDQRLEVRTTP